MLLIQNIYIDLENQILVDLQHAVVNLKNDNWNAVFLEKRIDIMDYFSEKNILDLTGQVLKLTKSSL